MSYCFASEFTMYRVTIKQYEDASATVINGTEIINFTFGEYVVKTALDIFKKYTDTSQYQKEKYKYSKSVIEGNNQAAKFIITVEEYVNAACTVIASNTTVLNTISS